MGSITNSEKHVKEGTVNLTSSKGVIDEPSNHSVEQTVENVKNMLRAKGITLFALIDHSGESGHADASNKALDFRQSKAGTPLMLAAPRSAIDLPLKILVWEDVEGKTWVSYNSLSYLQERHALKSELMQNIAVIETLDFPSVLS